MAVQILKYFYFAGSLLYNYFEKKVYNKYNKKSPKPVRIVGKAKKSPLERGYRGVCS